MSLYLIKKNISLEIFEPNHLIPFILIFFWSEISRTNTQKRYPFHYRGLECKSRRSRNTWSSRQIWPSGQRLIDFCQENTVVIANTLFQQHRRRLYIWTSPGGQHRNQVDYILCSQRWRSAIVGKNKMGADCGSNHELLITKFKLKLKKVGKTTRPFRYDLIKSLIILQWKWEIDLRD